MCRMQVSTSGVVVILISNQFKIYKLITLALLIQSDTFQQKFFHFLWSYIIKIYK